ncbi:MAG TPA: uracil phosphoribosyltransferase [Phycisphaerae bacterium]|nr:uracil phosphoribosyltransferase [Phycisphaerae bacterium]
MPVTICDHPMIRQALGELRRKETPPLEFRERVGELARYLSYEAARDLALAAVEIETPIQKTIAHRVAEERIILAPILRAGLAMIEGAIATFPHAQVRHIGIFRDEKTAMPVEYYVKLPARLDPETLVIILDPMLATGGSACMAIDAFARRGITRFKFVCLIAAPEGVAAVESCYPQVPIYTASVDERLNDRKFIVPGLGDAGDRCFGTT